MMASRWRQGEHVTIVAPTGFGKTHLALAIVELRRYVIFLACKRNDPLVTSLQADGYHVTADLDRVVWVADPARGREEPTTPKVVYWPRQPEKMEDSQWLPIQAHHMRRALSWANRTGNWAVVVDESMYMTDQLRLEKQLNQLWYMGRTEGISVLMLSQRPARVPRQAFAQGSYFYFGQFSDHRDLENVRDISSTIPADVIMEAVRRLSKDRHEFLFVDAPRGELAVVVAPPR